MTSNPDKLFAAYKQGLEEAAKAWPAIQRFLNL